MNTEIQKAFHAAVSHNDIETARRMIAAGADVNAPYDEYENRSFLDACYRGNLAMVKMLVEAGADVNLPDACGVVPLVRAIVCLQDADEVINYLIDIGADVMGKDGSMSLPLHVAVSENDIKIAAQLLTAGANPNIEDDEGKNALFGAVENGNERMLLLLLNHGADVNHEDEDGYTPLSLACIKGNVELCKLLIEHGAKSEGVYSVLGNSILMDAILGGNPDCVKLILKQGVDVNVENNECDTALSMAIFYNMGLDIVEQILNAGADPNARDSAGKSAFEWAWANRRHAPHCVACLIMHGAQYRPSLFLRAVYEKKREIITAMLGSGVDVNTTDPRGNTALHYAVRSNSVAIIRELIEAGADIEARNHDNFTSLMLAICKRRCEAATVLMQAGADKHAFGGELNESIVAMCSRYLTEIDGNILRKVDWRTGISRGWQFSGLQSKHLNKLLMDCCWNADIDMAKELIKAGANPDYQDGRGYTPLMLASAGGSLELVQYLLEQGADINACEYEKGWDALCLAGWNNRTEICHFLSKKRHDK